jgi:hypothetical protein
MDVRSSMIAFIAASFYAEHSTSSFVGDLMMDLGKARDQILLRGPDIFRPEFRCWSVKSFPFMSSIRML